MRASNNLETLILSSVLTHEYVRSDNARALARIVRHEKVGIKEVYDMDGFRLVASGKSYTEFEIRVKEDGYWCEYGVTRKHEKAFKIAERVANRIIRETV